jgi:hypothetical protein
MLRSLLQIVNKIRFSSDKYWEIRYKNGGNSGSGSYDKKAEYKAKILNLIIDKYSIVNLIEFGCGDGNNLGYYDIDLYTGLDVSQAAIKLCINKYKDDKKKSFLYYDPKLFKSGGLKAELTISFEVIFHLIENSVYEKYMFDLFNTSSRYVLIFSSDSDNIKDEAIHVKHRKFTKDIPGSFKLIEKIQTPQDGYLNGFFSNFYLFERISA